MREPKKKIRGRFSISAMCEPFPIDLCESVRVNHRGRIELTFTGAKSDLYLQVDPAMAEDVIRLLRCGLEEIRETG